MLYVAFSAVWGPDASRCDAVSARVTPPPSLPPLSPRRLSGGEFLGNKRAQFPVFPLPVGRLFPHPRRLRLSRREFLLELRDVRPARRVGVARRPVLRSGSLLRARNRRRPRKRKRNRPKPRNRPAIRSRPRRVSVTRAADAAEDDGRALPRREFPALTPAFRVAGARESAERREGRQSSTLPPPAAAPPRPRPRRRPRSST